MGDQGLERRQGQNYSCLSGSLEMAEPLDQYDFDSLKQRFATVVKVKPGLQCIFSCNFFNCLGLLNHRVGGHRQADWGRLYF